MTVRSIPRVVCVLAAGGVLALSAMSAMAATQSSEATVALAQETIRGTIQHVDLEHNWFMLKTSDGETVRISVSEKTQYTLNGETASKDQALQKDAQATVQQEDNKASRVDVRTG